MADSKRIIKISEYSLESFAVYDSSFYDITLLPLATTKETTIKCDYYRKFTLDDMAVVLEKVLEKNTDAGMFFLAWFEPLIAHFYDNLMLNTLFGDYPSAIESYRLVFMPQTDDDLLRWIIAYLTDLLRDLSPVNLHQSAADYMGAEDLLHMIDLQCDEYMLPVEEREYIDEIKNDFIRELDNDLILKDADRYTKSLFRKYVNELSEKNNFNALRIKGFACNGGNSVFKCDFQEAARCMEILWKEGGFGYAANTLGFMHLEGRLTDGKPDLDQAFKYFSIGHAFGISESTYKLSEMFMNGVYVSRSLETAASLIERLYVDSRFKFEQEDFEGTFAEAAMHMGQLQLRIYEERPDNIAFIRDQALSFYLQAQFAVFMRSQFGSSLADKKLLSNIDAKVDELLAGRKIYKTSYKSRYPDHVKEFINARPFGNYKLTVKRLKNDRVKLTIDRLPWSDETYPALSLMTYNEFALSTLTDSVSVTCNKADVLYEQMSRAIVFDNFSFEDTPDGKTLIRFTAGTKLLATIKAESFTISRP
ncbi:MAG: hypothetical protein IJ757_06260 [Clostridiales bacterium]|nr:hypothetical protein [Clostridiales bacterium]